MDTETGELISDAEVAEVPYTAFASKPANLQYMQSLSAIMFRP